MQDMIFGLKGSLTAAGGRDATVGKGGRKTPEETVTLVSQRRLVTWSGRWWQREVRVDGSGI